MIFFNLCIICINIKFDFHLQKREEKEIITHFRFAIDFHHFNYTQKNTLAIGKCRNHKNQIENLFINL